MVKDKPSKANVEESDGNIISEIILKPLDINKYATKKTIAQGLLDVALLTANASQLKHVLQIGEQHEFYTLMISLIIISILLQLAVAILFVIIGGLNLNKEKDHKAAIILNDIILIFIFFISIVNIIISGFGLDYSSHTLKLMNPHEKHVTAALLSVIVTILTTWDNEKVQTVANILNHISLAFVTGTLFSDIIKMNFGLEPAIALGQAWLCIVLGRYYNINKENDQQGASYCNNIVMFLNVALVVVNILIGIFEMKESTEDYTLNGNDQSTTSAVTEKTFLNRT
ncbi:hypothetical protein NQ315_009654 [Exocentrus adspersus]|uniref:Ninjurin-2 n=1 Tax=Exocentrus adspersus TaxID=1586481 RepID=A0AAV8WGW6_9CUCU|nr:hypothetical protein NQ315_009654 [Exocentrus adspersus]